MLFALHPVLDALAQRLDEQLQAGRSPSEVELRWLQHVTAGCARFAAANEMVFAELVAGGASEVVPVPMTVHPRSGPNLTVVPGGRG